jgi:Ca2+-binding EF-hand superfamily protein
MTSTNDVAPTFALMDTDNDGFITVGEFTRMLNLLGEWRVSDEIATSMFGQVDTDDDGKVTLDEFTAYLHTQPPAN